MMDKHQMIESIRSGMPERRWQHVQGVISTAIVLAGRFGADPDKAELAAILHDLAKYWPVDRMEEAIREEGADLGILSYDKELWHAPAGAWISRRDYGVADIEVLDAVRYHTSGRAGMTLLDKVVCLADYMEPGRDFPGVEGIRELAETDLDAALGAGFDSTIRFLLEKGKVIYPLTLAARNDLITTITNRH
ncbi:putative HD superfamily hydrolase of NAD metabolism [Paenibacillus sp. RU4T]|nr:putative HD superfamily hydrolase of NAD metabolism [Paenibacillus sp. RU4X]SIQ34480.1 putative HD superfamily hydrolase of NAD metabolism [Paenibacillus sp. RU4T]